jgi:hypothetical protein
MAIFGANRMFKVIAFQFPMTIETDRNEIVWIVVGWVAIYVVDHNICGTSFATETAMPGTPQQ